MNKYPAAMALGLLGLCANARSEDDSGANLRFGAGEASSRVDEFGDSVIASALLRLPVGSAFSLYGKLGHAFYETGATARLGAVRESESASESDFTFGFALELAVWCGVQLRAEYEAGDVNEGDFEMVSAGVAYKF